MSFTGQYNTQFGISMPDSQDVSSLCFPFPSFTSTISVKWYPQCTGALVKSSPFIVPENRAFTASYRFSFDIYGQLSSCPCSQHICHCNYHHRSPVLNNVSPVRAFTHLSSLPQYLFHSTPHLCVLITIMTNCEDCCSDILYFLGNLSGTFYFSSSSR